MKSGHIHVTIGDDGSMMIDLLVDDMGAQEGGAIAARLCKQIAMGLLKGNPDVTYAEALSEVLQGFADEVQDAYLGMETSRTLNG